MTCPSGDRSCQVAHTVGFAPDETETELTGPAGPSSRRTSIAVWDPGATAYSSSCPGPAATASCRAPGGTGDGDDSGAAEGDGDAWADGDADGLGATEAVGGADDPLVHALSRSSSGITTRADTAGR